MAGQFVMKATFRADNSSLRAGAAEARRDVTSVGDAAEKATPALDRHSKANRDAAIAVRELAAEEKRAREELARVSGARPPAVLPTARAALALPANISGLSVPARGAATADLVGPSRSQEEALRGVSAATVAAAREASLYRQELDHIRAQYNPLFAASQQYEAALRDIAAAEQLGAISAREAAAARQVAANRMAPINDVLGRGAIGMNRLGAAATNAGFQVQDFFVQIASGQSAMVAATQQLPQLLGAFGFSGKLALYGALAGTAVAVGAAVIPMLLRSADAAKTLDDRLADLEATNDRLAKSFELLTNVRLDEKFGSFTGSVRELARGLVELERAAGRKQLGQVIDEFLSEEVDVGFGGIVVEVLTASRGAPARTEPQIEQDRYAALGAANTFSDFEQRTAAITKLAESGDVEGVLRDVLALKAAMSGGGSFTGMAEELRTAYALIASAAIETAELEANLNGSARAMAIWNGLVQSAADYWNEVEARARAVADYTANAVRDQNQRLALAQAEAVYGRESEQYASAKAQIERDNLELALERQGVFAADRKLILEQYDATVAVGAATGRWQQMLDGVSDRLRGIGGLLLAIGESAGDVAGQELELGALRGGASPDDAAYAAQLDQLNRQYDARLAGAKSYLERELIESERFLAQRKLQLDRELTVERDAAQKRDDQMAAGRDYLRGQEETLQMLRLEASLLGETEATRARLLALAEAEQWIRSQQIDTNSELAGQIREAAAAKADETRELQNQIDAWGRVEDAAGSAIDSIVDSLMDADIGGAFDAVLKEVTGLFTDLAIKNPLKNAILGTDAPTLQDAGGLGGIWDRLTGQGAALSPTASSMGVGSMTVTAATVILNGNIAGALGGVTGGGFAANLGVAPGTSMSGGVQQQVWEFFTGKGLQPHQVAGIMGNVQGESAFNPLAAGDYRNGQATSYGLFQHHDTRADALLGSLGGKGGLGNVQGQLDHVWQELMTSENGALQKLLASTDVAGATSAWMTGFERPSEQAMTDSWPTRLGAAEAAMTTFTATTGEATAGLGTLGGGFDAFGSALSGALTGGAGAEGLFGTIFGAMGIPGFATGGYTGSGHPARVAGVVHEEEYVFDAGATAAIGVDNLEALRQGARSGWRGGFASGGYVSALPVPAPPPANRAGGPGVGGPMRMSFNLVNNSGVPIEAEGEATVDEAGGITVDARLNRAVAQAVTQRGGPTDKALRSRGAKQQTWRRS